MKIRYTHPLVKEARAWWSAMSINEMKAMAVKYDHKVIGNVLCPLDSAMVWMYEEENKIPHTEGQYD